MTTTYKKLLQKRKKDIEAAIKKISKKPSLKGEMKFYEYKQNNSGGRFVVNKKLCHRVIIQAPNKEVANSKAFKLGIYFDGCSIGTDCSCCGDRWYPPHEALKYDLIFDTIEQWAKFECDPKYSWTAPEVRIYFANGKVKEFFSGKVRP